MTDGDGVGEAPEHGPGLAPEAGTPEGAAATPAGRAAAGSPVGPAIDPLGRFSRRGFLEGAAGLAASIAALKLRAPSLAARLASEHARLLADPRSELELPKVLPDLVAVVERDTDLVLLDFAFYGFKLSTATKPRYIEAGADNLILVQFPPQAIGEAAYWNATTSGPLPADPAPALSVLSGPSRLSFSIPGGEKIPFPTMTAADLLDWGQWTLNVPTGALTDSHIDFPEEPNGFETWVECPYGLILSPVVNPTSETTRRYTQMLSRVEPLTTSTVTDCWSTMLTGPLQEIAAVWATDYDGPPDEGTAAATSPKMYIKYES